MHYVLLTAIIILQLIILLLWYNERSNEGKLEEIKSDLAFSEKTTNLVDDAKENYNLAQLSLQEFLQLRDIKSLENYFQLIENMSERIDTLNKYSSENEKFKALLQAQQSLKYSINQVKKIIDSTFQKNRFTDIYKEIGVVELKDYDYEDILNSVDVETQTKVDSITRKKFFSRILDAISGRIAVQKEVKNQTIIMKYGKKVESGNLEKQIQTIFKNAGDYYQNQFKIVKGNYEILRENDLNLVSVNQDLADECENVLNQFNKAATQLHKDNNEAFNNQFETNKSIRFFSILGIVLIMLVISCLLFMFTQLAFDNEKKLKEAQETIQQNLTFKNRIVGMLSHEIRSPLSLISIYSKKVSATIEDIETQEVFKSIQFTTNSLLVMVNQVLDFSKQEQTKLVLNKIDFDLNQELNQILHNLSNLVENSGNVLVVESNVVSQCDVFSDPTKIHQLLYNIIGNANKFTEKGEIKLLIEAQKINKNQLAVHFEVVDNGRGISESDLSTIFDGFYKGVVSDKVNDLGTGLGLNLCKELVELFEGTIQITSQVYHGTKVVFNIKVNCK